MESQWMVAVGAALFAGAAFASAPDYRLAQGAPIDEQEMGVPDDPSDPIIQDDPVTNPSLDQEPLSGEEELVEPGTGGSPQTTEPLSGEEEFVEPGTGGSPQTTEPLSGEEELVEPGTGGSPEAIDPLSSEEVYVEPGTGGSPQTFEPAPAVAFVDKETPMERGIQDRLSVTLGGGIEGFTEDLGDRFEPGGAWGAAIGVQPLTWMGAELGYRGSVAEVDDAVAGSSEGVVNGADLVRNGWHFGVSFNAPTPYVQPYVLAGIGSDRYDARGGGDLGMTDDTTGRVPLGGGLRARIGSFTADLRGTYDLVFDEDFSGLDPENDLRGAYAGMLQIGGRF